MMKQGWEDVGRHRLWGSAPSDNDAVVVIDAVDGGFGVAVTVVNEGPADADDVTWTIDVQGSLWPTGFASGTIARLPAGQQTMIRSTFFLGMGPVELVELMVQAGGDVRRGSCHVFGPFTFDIDMVQAREEAVPDDAVKSTPTMMPFRPWCTTMRGDSRFPCPGRSTPQGPRTRASLRQMAPNATFSLRRT